MNNDDLLHGSCWQSPNTRLCHRFQETSPGRTTCQAGPLHSNDAVDAAENIHSSNYLQQPESKTPCPFMISEVQFIKLVGIN